MRMQFRKGAAYWSPGARLCREEELRQDLSLFPTLSGVLALNPKRVKLKLPSYRTRRGSGPRTKVALEIWRAGLAIRTVLTPPIPATVWPETSRKLGGRQLRKYAHG